MFENIPPAYWPLGFMALIGAGCLLHHHFNAEARERRRRGRSHGRVVSKSKRVMIRLAARVPKPRDKDGR
jgi:hypothetical protein